MHCADNYDRGGNDIHVVYDGRKTNLHAVWDIGILAPAVNGDERAYALQLAGLIVPKQATRWSAETNADWANETYTVARRGIYAELLRDRGTLPGDYSRRMLPVADQQLEKAGVRLAASLNSALR